MDDHESDSNLDEEEEAFLDVNDPENQILDDGLDEAPPSDDDSDEGEGGAAGAKPRNQEDEEPEEPQGEKPTEKEPERDDALIVFAGSVGGRALHCVSANAKNPRVSAVGGESDEIYVLDGGALQHTLRGHTDTITSLKFSPDGAMLASGCMDATVRLWDAATGQLLHVLEDLSGEVECLLWHPSGLLLVAGATDAQAVMWNAKKGTAAQYFVGHRGAVTCAEWACDNKKLVTGSADGSVFVFSPKTGEAETVFPTKELSKDGAGIVCLADLGSNDAWACGCEDGTVHVLSISRGKVVQHLQELHEQCIEAMQAAPALGYLLTASCDCLLLIWNLCDFTLRVRIAVGEGVTCARWLGPWVVAGCTDGDVRIWDGRAAAQEPSVRLVGHRRLITALEIVSGTNLILTTSDDGTARAFPQPPVTA